MLFRLELGNTDREARSTMSTRYEPISIERFTIEQTAFGEAIKIKAPRQIFMMLFLPFWLAAWSVGGGKAIVQLQTHFQLFLLFWLCLWALAWCAAAGTLLWMFAGSETIAVRGSDVEIRHRALGFSWHWLYQGSRIKNLSIAAQPTWPYQMRGLQVPFLRTAQYGSVKFDYGPRTIFMAQGLDESEARMIVERLTSKLPAVG